MPHDPLHVTRATDECRPQVRSLHTKGAASQGMSRGRAVTWQLLATVPTQLPPAGRRPAKRVNQEVAKALPSPANARAVSPGQVRRPSSPSPGLGDDLPSWPGGRRQDHHCPCAERKPSGRGCAIIWPHVGHRTALPAPTALCERHRAAGRPGQRGPRVRILGLPRCGASAPPMEGISALRPGECVGLGGSCPT